MKVIETDRLVLSTLSLDDIDFILKLLNEPSFHKYIGDKGVRSSEEAAAYLEDGPIKSYERYGYGLYLVKLKDEDFTPIGISGIKKRDSMKIPELGYAFLKKYWSMGFATESAKGVMNYARLELDLKQVAALTAPDNLASIRVLKKLGFRFSKLIELPDFESESKMFTADL